MARKRKSASEEAVEAHRQRRGGKAWVPGTEPTVFDIAAHFQPLLMGGMGPRQGTGFLTIDTRAKTLIFEHHTGQLHSHPLENFHLRMDEAGRFKLTDYDGDCYLFDPSGFWRQVFSVSGVVIESSGGEQSPS